MPSRKPIDTTIEKRKAELKAEYDRVQKIKADCDAVLYKLQGAYEELTRLGAEKKPVKKPAPAIEPPAEPTKEPTNVSQGDQ
jgi:hypothetical protein